MPVLCKGVQVAGTGVEKGVGRGRGGGEDNGVDDRGKAIDPSSADGNDPGRRSSTRCAGINSAEKILVVAWDEDTDC